MPQEQGEEEGFLTKGSERMIICSEFSDKWWSEVQQHSRQWEYLSRGLQADVGEIMQISVTRRTD